MIREWFVVRVSIKRDMTMSKPHDRIVHRPELIHETVFIAPGAVVVGDVTLEEQASVWFTAVLRGDTDPIRVGRRSNIQDGAVLHADPGAPCTIGAGVTVGHRAIVHGATVGDNVVVGMGSIILNRAQIGENSIVAAGALVTEDTVVPPGSLVMGVPAKVRRALSAEEIEGNRWAAEHYVENAKRYRG
jgi:carbonic anhydrase/acetyltransferase-like protein (isoleucine patch superfamily)